MSKIADMYNRARGYLAGVHKEMKECVWPSWAELRGSTVVVVVSVVLLSAYVGLCDLALNWSIFDVFLKIGQ